MASSQHPMIATALIVDDNASDIEWCRIMMKKSGRYPHVYECSGAEAALELFTEYETSRAKHPEKFPPVVIFLDINMPRMNGFEFLERFEALREEILARGDDPSLVLMLSSSERAVDRDRASAFSSVRDYVTKPLTVERAIAIADRFGQPSH